MKIHKAINILLIVVLLLTGFSASPNSISAQGPDEKSPDQMNTFSVLAGLGAESQGVTQIEGSLGIAAEGAEALGDWQVGGEKHFGPDSLAASALEEAVRLNAQLAEKACDTTVASDEKALTTVVLTPGVTCFEGETVFLDELMLENKQEESEFIIRATGDIIFSEDSSVSLTEPKLVASIYWQIAGSLVAGERSQLQGTFLVASGIETGLQTDVTGQLISLEDSVLVKESRVHFKADLPTPEPPIEPTEAPIPEPTEEPTPEPTEEPTPEPTEEPTPEPTEEPTPEPTEAPMPEPTEEPTPEPTLEPTVEPTEIPIPEPTVEPTPEPTVEPTPEPTVEPQISENPFTWEMDIYLGGENDSLVQNSIDLLEAMRGSEIEYLYEEGVLTIKGNNNVEQLRALLYDELTGRLNFMSGPVEVQINLAIPAKDFTVKLDAKPGTGYAWYVQDLKTEGYTQFEESQFGARASIPGGSTIQTMTLSATDSKYHSIGLQYQRPFEDAIPQKTLRIQLLEPINQIDLTDPTPEVAAEPEYTDSVDAEMELATALDLLGGVNALPASLDWRSSGIVSPIRDQRYCGSCYAFGTVGVMESAVAKAGAGLPDLSEQFLVDCAYTSDGCGGGYTEHKFHYNQLATNQTTVGAVLESTLPYTSEDMTCNNISSHPYRLSSWNWASTDLMSPTVTELKTALYTYGPIQVGVCVGTAFSNYDGGIFSTNEYLPCTNYYKNFNHWVILVGYDDATQTWILRNSWGSWWGENGYMRIKWGTSVVGREPSWAKYTHTSTIPTPLSPYGIIYQKYPTFTWTKVANATSYNVQVYTPNGIVTNKIVYPSACGATQCSAVIGPLPYVSQYFWRVNAYSGGWGAWSEYKYFTRLDPIPTLVWPSGTITVSNPFFQWKPILGATSYNIELYDDHGLFAYKTVTNWACNSTICSVILSNNLPIGNYYWRVKVYIEGSWNSFSSFKYFTRTMPAPTPISPSGYIYLKYPTFTWTKIANATSYNVQVYTASGRVTNRIVYPSACGATQCSAVIGPLPYVSQYFWRVNAYVGGWGSWSEYKYFTRLDPVPTLVWPFGAITIPNPYFQWRPLAGATSYNIELYNINGLYSNMTVTSGNCNSTVCSVKLSDFLPLGNYYWRVKSFTEGSWNSFSPFMYFVRPGFQNPGFEQGAVAWSEYSSTGFGLIVEGYPVPAHGGSWLAWLGGADDEISEISQSVTISSAAPYLHFWYYANSTDVCNYDTFSIGVNGTAIMTMNLCEPNSTNGWIEMVVNLSGYVGSDQWVYFNVLTDSSYSSSVFLDDISLTSSATASQFKPILENAYPVEELSR